jgi:hypothetical protein
MLPLLEKITLFAGIFFADNPVVVRVNIYLPYLTHDSSFLLSLESSTALITEQQRTNNDH